jgi:P-type Cu+ transporter
VIPVADAFVSDPGRGVRGRVEGRAVLFGNARFLSEAGVDVTSSLSARADELRAAAQTVMFLAVDGQPAALVGVADRLKPSAVGAIHALHADGLRIVMLTAGLPPTSLRASSGWTRSTLKCCRRTSET